MTAAALLGIGPATGPAAGPSVGTDFEAQLLAILERPVSAGDSDAALTRLVEFEGLLLHLDEPLAAALHRRLSAESPPPDDRLARAFKRAFSTTNRRRIVARIAAVAADYRPVHIAQRPARSKSEIWRHMAPGEKSWNVELMGRVDAPDGVVLRSRPFGTKDGPTLPFDTLVTVQRETEKGWYYAISLGETHDGDAPFGAGFIEKYHLAGDMPEPTAHLYQVQPGDLLKDIAARFYGHGFGWGHDARLYVQAIYHANKNRDVVFRQKADLSVDRRALSTKNRDQALALWEQARVVSGQALWVPSEGFVARLHLSGDIHHGSLSKQAFEDAVDFVQGAIDAAQYTGGFVMGLFEGAWGALQDLFSGMLDLIRALWVVAKAMVGDYSALIRFARKLNQVWSDRDKLAAAVSTDFMRRWHDSDDWDRGNFQGEVLGYVTALAFITLVTVGAGSIPVGTGRFGSFVKLIEFADAAGSITTYAGKLASKVKLPGNVVAQVSDLLRKRRGADFEAQGRPGKPGGEWDTMLGPGNRGEPYTDPRETPNLPRRGLDKHELATIESLRPFKLWNRAKKALRNSDGVPLGEPLKKAEDGHAIIARLARGDASALEDIGVKGYPDKLDPTGREWALVQTRRYFLIYAGKYGGMRLPANVRPLAHNHPGPNPSAGIGVGRKLPTQDIKIPDRRDGMTYDELISDWNMAKETGITPSAEDIHAITDGSPHIIYTRYVHKGDGRIANPDDSDLSARVSLHLSDAKVVRWNKVKKEFYYEVDLQVKDAADTHLWQGKMYVYWHRASEESVSHKLYPWRPAILSRNPPPNWQE